MKEQGRAVSIIGNPGTGTTAVIEALKAKDIQVVSEPIIDQEEEHPLIANIQRSAERRMIINQMLQGGYKKKTPQRPSVNIIEEYALIQKKESNLSRRDRDWVVKEYNRLQRNTHP